MTWTTTYVSFIHPHVSIATKFKHENKFANLIKNTWEPPLKKSGPLPYDWIHNCEVLVGMRPQYAPIEEDL
jgi:hypothetical protein